MPHKIAIIGSPGAGKSTFAVQLQKATGLPLYHLDQLHFLPNWEYAYTKEEWLVFMDELTAREEWIIDGNYFATLEQRIRAADTIIYLQISPLKALHRIFKRRLQYHKKARPDTAPGCQERIHQHLFKSILSYPFRSHPRIMQLLTKYHKKAVVLRNAWEMQEYLESLT